MKVVLLQILLFIVFSNSIQGQHFAGGDGSAGNPWQIMTPSHLDSVRHFSGDHFILMNDIDLSFDTGHPDGQFWNDGAGWERIGPYDDGGFVINLNGNGKIINGLKIDGGAFFAAGLFGYLKNSTIRNLGLSGINFKFKSIIPSYIGGIVGIANNLTISSSFVQGEVEARNNTGGLVGNLSGKIQNSYSFVEMTGFFGLTKGGLAAYIRGEIINSYALGYVNRSYFDSGEEIGPLAADSRDLTIVGSYFNSETTGFENHEFGLALKTSELLQRNSLSGWDLSDEGEWRIIEGESYPFLNWQIEPEAFNYPKNVGVSKLSADSRPTSIEISWEETSFGNPIGYNVYTYEKYNDQPVSGNTYTVDVESPGLFNFYYIRAVYSVDESIIESPFSEIIRIHSGFNSGNGTSEHPYEIGNVDQLQLINITRNNQFSLTNNIDASATVTLNDGLGFEPLHDDVIALNGNGYYIDSLYINRPDEDYVGLFSRIACCSEAVFDLGLINANVIGNDNVGILAGDNLGHINRIYASGSVKGNENVGGIIGISQDHNYNTYANVNVTGVRNVGGITGYAMSSDFGFHVSIGPVTGNENVGGVIGYVDSPTSFNEPLFWNIETSGVSESIVGTGLTTVEMSNQSNFEDFDFDKIWIMDDERGYPVLKWMLETPTNSEETFDKTPNSYSISQNYPNPFNPSTNIKFELPIASNVMIVVYDLLGREVATLIDDKMQAGYHQVTFDASLLASGMYIYRITAGNYTSTKKMLLIK